MSKSDVWESDLLKHVFQNLAVALIGDSAGLPPSVGTGNLYIGLHTADPGEAGDQTTNEATYTGYARVAVARSSGAWTVSGTAPSQVANAAAVAFANCTAGSNTITHFSVGTAAAGAGKLLYSGVLTSPLAVSTGIAPNFAIGALQITED